MRYKSFALIRRIVIILVITILVIWMFSALCSDPEKTSTRSYKTAPGKVEMQKPAYGSDKMAITEIDKEVFKYQKTDISSGKIDDQGDSYKKFINSANYKLDLRCDFKKGYSFWNRMKVDFDKDGKWDEKWWYLKDGQIRKEVSSDDNEKYDYKYVLNIDTWEKK